MDINYDATTFIWKCLNFKKTAVANFADIIKILTMFIKKTFKDSKKLKELEIMYSNAIYISISRYSKIC